MSHTRVALVNVLGITHSTHGADFSHSKEEGKALLQSLGITPFLVYEYRLRKYSPAIFITRGHAEAIKQACITQRIDLIFMNTALSPVQFRNLQKFFDIRVVDRTQIILDIFEQRVVSFEGKLQAQLSRTMYERATLIRSWTHLERQRVSGAMTGGPGERQLELDKRMLSAKIRGLKKKITAYEKLRDVQQQGRREKPLVAFIGYTNVGKSSLFNRVTGASTIIQNKVFATLDTTIRKIKTVNTYAIDTVGLISNLPSYIAAGFKATFDQVKQANILVQVHDVCGPYERFQTEVVDSVIQDLQLTHLPRVHVYNKSDIQNNDQCPQGALLVSAKEGTGIPLFLNALENALFGHKQIVYMWIPFSQSNVLYALYRYHLVVSCDTKTDGYKVKTLLTNIEQQKYSPYLAENPYK